MACHLRVESHPPHTLIPHAALIYCRTMIYLHPFLILLVHENVSTDSKSLIVLIWLVM